MKYFIVAGEASGDLHASGLIQSIRNLDTNAEIAFIGGDLMASAAECQPLIHYREMNVMGFSEVIRNAGKILSQLRQAKLMISDFNPDALILIDYPGFNLKLAKFAHKLGIATHYFISPKIWAWKEYRIRSIRRDVSYMYSILPFEVEYFRDRHNYKVDYVGNPTVSEVDKIITRMPSTDHFLSRLGINERRPIIALLPGSRRGEVKNNLPLMIEAAKKFPEFQYIVGAAPAIPLSYYREIAQDPGLNVAYGVSHTLVKLSQAALVTSGTATLETALLGTPQVVCYRANGQKISYKIMEKLLHVKYVSLPNLIADKRVIPELLVHQCTVESIMHDLKPLLFNSPQREEQLAGYKLIRNKLGTDIAVEKAASLIVERCSASAGKA